MPRHKTLASIPKNLLPQYLHMCGREEVPMDYNLWGFLTLIGALSANRIWLSRLVDVPLYLNLYTFLIGPSGSGKNTAIGRIFRYAKLFPKATHTHRGPITAQGLYDTLTEVSRLFVGMPELSESMRKGDIATNLIKTLTELYSGGDGEVNERTRGLAKQHRISNFVLSFIAGSTTAWLYDSVKASELESGFLGRIALIYVEEDPPPLYRPILPPDADLADLLIRAGLRKITQARGEIPITKAADSLIEDWYMSRPLPDTAILRAGFRRERELVLKLAGIAALCEYGASADTALTVQKHHAAFARRMAEGLRRNYMSLSALGDPANALQQQVFKVSNYLRNVKEATKPALLRFSLKHGILEHTLNGVILSLMESGKVTSRHDAQGNRVYAWKTISFDPSNATAEEESQEEPQ